MRVRGALAVSSLERKHTWLVTLTGLMPGDYRDASQGSFMEDPCTEGVTFPLPALRGPGTLVRVESSVN